MDSQCACLCMSIDSPSDATEVGGLADDGSDITHSACGGKWLLKCYAHDMCSEFGAIN